MAATGQRVEQEDKERVEGVMGEGEDVRWWWLRELSIILSVPLGMPLFLELAVAADCRVSSTSVKWRVKKRVLLLPSARVLVVFALSCLLTTCFLLRPPASSAPW